MQAADLECAGWLADAQVPFSLVFTKTDKRKKRCPSPRDNMKAFQVRRHVWHFLPVLSYSSSTRRSCWCSILDSTGPALPQAELQKAFENLPPMFETDAETLRGQPELLAHIAQLRAAYDED